MLLRLEEKIRRDSAWASPFLQFELIPGNCSLSVAAVSSSDPLVAVFLRPLSDFRYPLIFILFFPVLYTKQLHSKVERAHHYIYHDRIQE